MVNNEERIEKIENILGQLLNNVELIKQVIEFLEEASIEELIKEMRNNVVNDDINNNDGDGLGKYNKKGEKNVRKREFEQ